MALKDIGSAFTDIIGGVGGLLNPINWLDGYPSISGDLSSAKHLRYPADLSQAQMTGDLTGGTGNPGIFEFNSAMGFNTNLPAGQSPYIMFQLFKPVLNNAAWNTIEVTKSDNDLSGGGYTHADGSQPRITYDVQQSIALYMTPNIAINDSMAYETTTRSAVAALQTGITADSAGIDGMMAASHAADTALQAIAGGSFLSGKGGALISGAILGLAGPAKAWGDEHIRRSGKVYNSNEYLQFKNIALRSFNFQFKFLPNSSHESKYAAAIIKAFRAAMRPAKITALTMEAPYQVQTTFYGAGDMPQIGTTAITDLTVTYNPNSASFFRRDGNPVEIDFSITLQEIMPIYRQDITGEHISGGASTPKPTKNNVGSSASGATFQTGIN